MLPAQRNKVDISKLTPAEQQAFRLYGKLPNRPVQNKNQERKYFDSGDWVLAKEGKAKGVGTAHPKAEEIPHASPTPIGSGGSAGSPGSSAGTGGTPGLSMSGGGSSSSPPAGHPLSPPIGSGSGSIAIPMSGSAAPGSSSSHHFSADTPSSSINLSMSPGRVGVGQPLASSPTRSLHSSSFSAGTGTGISSYAAAQQTSPTGVAQNPLVARLEKEAAAAATTTPVGSTGNVIGKAQQHALPGSESNYLTSPTAAQPTSNLANSITQDDEVDGMELQ